MAFPDPLRPLAPPGPGYGFPAAPGAAGVLTNNGAGVLTWSPVPAELPAPPGPDMFLKSNTAAPFLPPVWSDIVEGGGF